MSGALAAAAASGRLHAATYSAHAQSHCPLEPHACVAWWPRPGVLEVFLGTQSISDMAEDLAVRFGLAREHVTVRAEHVGGAFGAKALLTMEAVAAAELARVTGLPVSVVLEREEEMVVGGYRPGVHLDLELASGSEGECAAVRARARTLAGVAVGSVSASMLRFAYTKGRPPKDLQDFDVFTNDAPAAPFARRAVLRPTGRSSRPWTRSLMFGVWTRSRCASPGTTIPGDRLCIPGPGSCRLGATEGP